MADESQAIRDVIATREAAIARADAEAAIAPLAEDVVIYSLAPPLAQDSEVARDADALRAWFATSRDGVRVALRDPVIQVDGDLAVAWGLANMTGDKAGEAGPGDDGLWYRMTIVLRRERVGWRIVHEHESVPFLMDGSFRAAVDLTP